MTLTISGNSLGENIMLARQKAGMTREQLAEELCVSPVMVYKYEKNAAKVHYRKLKKIAQVCGVTLEELTKTGAEQETATST